MIDFTAVGKDITGIMGKYDLKPAMLGGRLVTNIKRDDISAKLNIRQDFDLTGADNDVLSPIDAFELLCEELATYLTGLMRQKVTVGVANPAKMSPLGAYRYVFNRDDALSALLRNRIDRVDMSLGAIDLLLSTSVDLVKEDVQADATDSLRQSIVSVMSQLANTAREHDISLDYVTVRPKSKTINELPAYIIEIKFGDRYYDDSSPLTFKDAVEMFAMSELYDVLKSLTARYRVSFHQPTAGSGHRIIEIDDADARQHLGEAAVKSVDAVNKTPFPSVGLSIRVVYAG